MPADASPDVVVVGSGPNGLACAIELARAGRKVLVLEAQSTPGGGMRTAELTLPGFAHDVCSAVHPAAAASPFFQSLPLEELGVEWIRPRAALAHPLDDGTAALLEDTVEATAASLGNDGAAYTKLITPLAASASAITTQVLAPPRPPRHPVALARFFLHASRSVATLARTRFDEPHARALLAGTAAHAMVPLDRLPTAGVALMFCAMAHDRGWPIVRGGSQRLADAMVEYLRKLGGTVECDRPVRGLGELPDCRAVVFDVAPRNLLRIAGGHLPQRYRRALGRFRYGPGVFKIDWALREPIPWTAPACSRAGTVHVCGTFEEIAAAEDAVHRGVHPQQPYVLLSQPSVFDPSRAPEGHHVAWAYCHVPHGSTVDMTGPIEDQVERFAPGFRDVVVARSTMHSEQMQDYNANYVGGDINCGASDWRQLFTRPVVRLDPYSTPNRRIFLCSSATPPGGGVHGMCGVFAARSVLRRAPLS